MEYLDGAYRLHRKDDTARFTSLAVAAFPQYAGRIECFGADWLGRQFATDSSRHVNGAEQVLMLNPTTDECFEIPCTIEQFHENEIVNFPEEALEFSFFQRWLASGGAAPAYDQCVSFEIPLFLGGAFDASNLELCDFEVYWGLGALLLEKVRNLPEGTPIGSISLGD